MRSLRFVSMGLEDFKEFRGKHQINFDFYGAGVHFVSGWNFVQPRLGSNGAGKSTLWDALCWCLYGKTVAGLRNPDVRTWGTKNHAEVSLTFEAGNDRIVINRSTKTNGLMMNGKLVEQAEIDAAVGMSYDIFLLAIVHGQGQPLFLDLKPTEKMARLSEALDLDRWEARSDQAKKAVQAFDLQLSSGAGQLEELKRTAADAERQLINLEDRHAAWEKEQADEDKGRAKDIKEAKAALIYAEKNMGNCDLALDRNETEARASRKQKAKLDNAYAKCMGVVGAAAAALKVLLDEREKLASDDRPENCPTCGQKVSANKQHREHIAKRLRDLDTEIEDARAINEAAVSAASKNQREAEKVAKELREFEDKADDARDGFTRAKSAMSEAAARLKQLEKEQAATERALSPFADLIKKQKQQLRKLDSTIDELIALLEADKVKRERTVYWVKGFKNVRLYLIQEVLEELTAVTQNLLPLIGLEGWIIEYSMERETQSGKVLPGLNVNIFKPDGDAAIKWEAWSGGEGQRLRIAGAVGLSQVLLRRAGVDCDLIILDEPTKHLSEEGVADMIDFLAELGKDHQVFYIDHSARPTKRFAKGLRIEKHSDGSRIAS